MSHDDLDERVHEMRASFDEAFAHPTDEHVEAPIELLLLHAGGLAFAVRTSDLAEVFRTPPITSLPSRAPGLVGLVGHRATLIALYGLAAMLDPSAPAIPGEWSVTTAASTAVAFCFDGLDGTVRVFEDDLLGGDGSGPAVVRLQGATRRLLHLPDLLASLAPSGRLTESAS